MTETQTAQPAPTPLTYSPDMVERMRVLLNAEIGRVQTDADRRVAELMDAMRQIEARQAPRPTLHPYLPEGRKGYPQQGANPYAAENAPNWAEDTKVAAGVERLMAVPEDGGDDAAEVA